MVQRESSQRPWAVLWKDEWKSVDDGRFLVAPGRLERPTNGLGNRCSIHLSYGATRGGNGRRVAEKFRRSPRRNRAMSRDSGSTRSALQFGDVTGLPPILRFPEIQQRRSAFVVVLHGRLGVVESHLTNARTIPSCIARGLPRRCACAPRWRSNRACFCIRRSGSRRGWRSCCRRSGPWRWRA